MRYLLDTQVLIWWFESSSRLSVEYKEIIESESVKFVSVASFWEMIIKIKAKKLKLKKSIDFLIKSLDFQVLKINLDHVLALQKISNYHKDPFDRMIIAQTKVEGLILLTSDKKIMRYFEG